MNEFVRLFGRGMTVLKRYVPKPDPFVKLADQKRNLIIFEDIFPHPLYDWRINEHTHYLENIPNSYVYTGGLLRWDERLAGRYADDRIQYLKSHRMIHPDQVLEMKLEMNINTKLAYCLFYQNMVRLFPYFEKFNIPFAFTLYPGGDFRIYNSESEKNLRKIFQSRYFRHVFVNMPFVYNYLLEELNVPAEKVTFIYSAPLKFDDDLAKMDLPLPKTEGPTKVCFISHKYCESGLDKGFDVFCKVAKAFEGDGNFKFSVIGDFSKPDMAVATTNIQFLGNILPAKLSDELNNCDVVLSPNRSFVLQKGAFDGFPTASVVHASMHGALMMVSDSTDNAPLLGLGDFEHLVLVSDRPSEICEKLKWVQNHPQESKEIARKGRKKLMELCNFERQLELRLKVIKELVND